MTIYHENINDGALTVTTGTPDTNFPITNLNNTNKNIFFKDTAIGALEIDFEILFTENRTIDYIVLGNYIATGVVGVALGLEYYDGSWNGIFSGDVITSATLNDFRKHFTENTGHLRFRVTFVGTGASNLTDIQVGNIYLGSRLALTTSPEIDTIENRGYKVNVSEGAGGQRFGQIANTTVRRNWQYNLKYVTEAEKTKLETMSGNVFSGDNLSLHPAWFSPNDDGTIFLGRTLGRLNFNQIAFQRYETPLIFDEEL